MAKTSSTSPKKKNTRSKKTTSKEAAPKKPSPKKKPQVKKPSTKSAAVSKKGSSKKVEKTAPSSKAKPNTKKIKKIEKTPIQPKKRETISKKAGTAASAGHVTDTKYTKKPKKERNATAQVIVALVTLIIAVALGFGIFFGFTNLLIPRLAKQSYNTNKGISDNHFSDTESNRGTFTETLQTGTSEEIDALLTSQEELKERTQDRIDSIFPGFDENTREYNDLLNESMESTIDDTDTLADVIDFIFCKKQVDEQARLIQQQDDSDEEIKKLYLEIQKVYQQERDCYDERNVETSQNLLDSTQSIADTAFQISESIGDADQVQANVEQIQVHIQTYRESTGEITIGFEQQLDQVFTRNDEFKEDVIKLEREIKKDLDID